MTISAGKILGGSVVFILAACNGGLGGTSPETACRIQTLLEAATSSVERGAAANATGELPIAIQAGEAAIGAGTELHALIGQLSGLSADILTDLESAAINAQQAGAYLATGSPSGGQSEENLRRVLQAMASTTERWTERLRNAGITCP